MNSTKTPIPLSGAIKVKVQGQPARPKWEQEALSRALKDGMGAINGLRFQCRIAQDANEAFAKSLQHPFVPNPRSKAQFGRNSAGLAFLTVGITNIESGVNIQLHWEGDSIPRSMVEVAVKHDEGRRVGAKTISLDLAKAQAWVLGEKGGHKPAAEPHGRPRIERGPRKHNRLCSEDLTRLYAAI